MEDNVIESAFKFMRLSDVRALNLTATNFGGPHINTLVSYLSENPNLISLTLDENPIYTNEIIKVAKTLKENKTPEFHKFIQEICIQYNIDKKTVIKQYYNYIIRNYPSIITIEYLNNIEAILHNDGSNIANMINYMKEIENK